MDERGRFNRLYVFSDGERIGYKSKQNHALYVKDHLGSTRMVVGLYEPNIDDAILVAGADTDAYGLITRDLNLATNDAEPHGYTGQEREDDLDLMYYGARFYMPELGRFLQVDPAREFSNSYSFVNNSPVLFIDPNGENIFLFFWSTDPSQSPSGAGHVAISVGDESAMIFFEAMPLSGGATAPMDPNYLYSGTLDEVLIQSAVNQHNRPDPALIISYATSNDQDYEALIQLHKLFYESQNWSIWAPDCADAAKCGLRAAGLEAGFNLFVSNPKSLFNSLTVLGSPSNYGGIEVPPVQQSYTVVR